MRKFLLLLSLLCCFTLHAKRRSLFFFFEPYSAHLYEDYYVNVNIVASGEVMQLIVFNKTDQVIYVDKDNSFAYVNDMPETLFQNSVQTKGKSTKNGVAMNLGGVASALGIRGGVGAIMNGTTIGNESGQFTSTSFYEKRILSIAPTSGIVLYTWNPFNDLERIGAIKFNGFAKKLWNARSSKHERFKKGEFFNYTYQNTPLRYKAVIKYSNEESFRSSELITIGNHLTDVVVDSYKATDYEGNVKPEGVQYAKQLSSEKPFVAYRYGTGSWPAWTLGIELPVLAVVLLVLLL